MNENNKKNISNTVIIDAPKLSENTPPYVAENYKFIFVLTL